MLRYPSGTFPALPPEVLVSNKCRRVLVPGKEPHEGLVLVWLGSPGRVALSYSAGSAQLSNTPRQEDIF